MIEDLRDSVWRGLYIHDYERSYVNLFLMKRAFSVDQQNILFLLRDGEEIAEGARRLLQGH